MSTPENPETPALTRRQLRELRQTGATPIIVPQPEGETPDTAAATAEAPVVDRVPEAAEPTVDEPSAEEAPSEPAPEHEPAVTAEPAPVAVRNEPFAPALRPDSLDGPFGDGDFGVTGLTRRQVRAQEKIRTAAVPVISSDLESPMPRQNAAPAPQAEAEAAQPAIFRPAAPDTAESPVAAEAAPGASVVNPALGSELLDGATPEVTLPDSFDQLLSRNAAASGAVSTPNALILSQTSAGVPLVGPVTATGEVMITGTFELPQGLGSVGHAPGTTDGRDADAVLLDGELPPASSPTPIAASAAISTVKQPGEIIRPPAPEKGSKLLIGLIITTGALFLAVAVTLGLAFTTGVFR
ncbi:hypothetical protein J2X55_001906 [Microbacterium sp. 1154]|uniref:hypothetical protein n=1 Tax=Microbacterium sp. 1154 TaxID=2817733 RepID=UPI00285DE309|nr:hypothetical protein [Microbacterium sp. 1154]MDR6690994.1 hypothetical protein [Microbacterium sp. 1154]